MNGQVNNAEYDFLWKLLANPAEPNHSYIFSLQSLVSDFPQSGALRALLMPNGDKRNIRHAAAYFNPVLLHKLATAVETLPRVSSNQIIFSDDVDAVVSDVPYNIAHAEPFVPPVPDAEAEYVQIIDDDAIAEGDDNATDTNERYAVPPPVPDAEPDVIVDAWRENIPAYIDDEEPAAYSDETPPAVTLVEPEHIAEITPAAYHWEPTPASSLEEQKNNLAREYEEYMAKTEITPAEPVSFDEEDEVRYFHQPIEDEVYDEIVSIEDIGLEQLAILSKEAREAGEGNENYFVFEPEITADTGSKAQPVPEQVTAAQETQYQAQNQPVPALAESNSAADHHENLSKYHDEKMPYTFMWWLDKTRKEHASIYQPYINNQQPVAAAPKQVTNERPVLDELQKQYYQSIVNNTPLGELYNDAIKAMGNHPSSRKEDAIIERFIQEEPHIKHPTDMKLDNENKAKRSSEDKEELVTETLARVYTEQMLYHKAIITYKKLMLKYPEKSLYFASHIEQLENKIN